MQPATALSQADRDSIRDAIAAAEAATAGEIFAVAAATSDDYRFIPLLWATLVALAAPLPLLLFTTLPTMIVYLVQLGVFILLALVLSLPAVRLRVVPRRVKHRRAHALAVQQFLAHGLHLTEARTGVLIFLSLGERYAEIIADSAISARVEQAVWDEIMAELVAAMRDGRLAEGLAAAIGRVGAVLATHFPPRPRDINELADDLILL